MIATGGNKYQIMYPMASGKYRIAWCSKTDYNKYCLNTSSSSNTSKNTANFQYPMKKYKQTVKWGQKVSYMSASRNAHLGIDLCPNGDNNIYAAASGTVKKTGYNNANGNFIIIQHTISGKTVYSFYAHLKSISTSNNKKVSVGEKIGVVGHTGTGGNGVNHLHFAFVNSYWKSGGYWGYANSFSGNKKTYNDAVYYNPTYIISNGKLPS